MALPKEKVDELLKSIKPREEKKSEIEEFIELLDRTNSGSDANLPFLLMALQNGKNGNELIDKVMYYRALKDLFKEDKPDIDIKEALREIAKETEERMERFEEKMLNTLEKLMPKPENETEKLLRELITRIEQGKGTDKDVNTLIELAKVFKPDTPQKDPLEIAMTLHKMNEEAMKELNSWKEKYYEDKNRATEEQLNQALKMIELNQNNSDFMTKLRDATETLDKFKEFATRSGLIQQPDPNASKEGKLDWKYILNSITKVISDVAPALKPPEKRPEWDIDAEARRIYNKYRDKIVREDGSPIDIDFVKQELTKNPNVAQQWDYEINKAIEQYKAEHPEMMEQTEAPSPPPEQETEKTEPEEAKPNEKSEEKTPTEQDLKPHTVEAQRV